MLVRPSDYQRPTDAAYAFQLRAFQLRALQLRPLEAAATEGLRPRVPPPGTRSDIRDVAREALGDAEAARFATRVQRWSGPDDVVGPDGAQPYQGEQLHFEERGALPVLTPGDVEAVLAGRVQVLQNPDGSTDYVLRDHHMVDVVLYHYRTRGELPRGLLHADRHSDWCNDSFLMARVPQQAATWWALLEGLKRPHGAGAALTERDIFFATAQAERTGRMSGRDVGFSRRVPGWLDPTELHWEATLERPGALAADWVSLDLDYFQPSPQLALSKGLLRDARFQQLLAEARVRVLCLSPQFTNGGDLVEPWEVQGSLASSLRLVNLLRAGLRGRVRTA